MKKSASKLLSTLSLARAGLASALAIILLGATAPRLAAQSDNFNDGNDTAGVAWTHYSLTGWGIPYGGTTYSFPDDGSGGKAYSLSAAATGTDPYGVKNARGGSYVKTNTYTTRFSVGTDLLAWSTVGRPSVGVLWYLHDIGLGTSDGYVGSFSPNYGNIYISIATNEAQQSYCCRLKDGDITLDPTNRIRMVASSHNGSTFVLTIYNLLEPNTPWASAIGADTTWQGYGGYSGYIIMNEDYPTNYGASATFDNYVATQPGAGTMPAMVTDVYPPPAGQNKGYTYVTNSVMILNRDTSVDTSSILLSLDGVWIPNGSLTIIPYLHKAFNPSVYQQDFQGATVTYEIPNLLVPGSKHTNTFAFKDDASTWRTNIWTWTMGYPDLFASNSLPVGALSARGWDYRMVQAANVGSAGNSLATAEQQLAIPPVIPYDVTYSTNGLQLLQWNDDNGWPNGVPGLDGTGHDNIACEMFGYMHLTGGAHRFYAYSDDGFQLRSGSSPGDLSAKVLGVRDGGTFNSTFDFTVEAEGLYPVRCIWYEHTGLAYFELDSVNLDDSSHVLINDPADPTGVVEVYTPTVIPLSSATVNGPYTVDHTAVVDENTKTVTVPLAGAAKFFRLSGPSATTLSAHVVGSKLVLTYL